jgi:hypothetical protein
MRRPLDAEAIASETRNQRAYYKLKILCQVDQAECFRRGIDAPSRTVKLEIDPSKIPANIRSFIAAQLYEGRKFGVRWYKGSQVEGGGKDRELCLDEFRLWRPDVLGFFETVLTAMAYEAGTGNPRSDFSLWLRHLPQKKREEFEGTAAELAKRLNQPIGPRSTGKLDDKTPTTKLVALELIYVQPPKTKVAPLKPVFLENPSQRYDGCHITIQVPKDFYREKDLLAVFDGAMPGLAVAIERRNGLSVPIVFAVGIAEKSGVFWNAKETLKRFLAQM